MCRCNSHHQKLLPPWRLMVQDLIFYPFGKCHLMTISETHPSHTSRHSLILCYGYVLLFKLKILGTIKCAQAPFLFFFFPYSSTNAQTYTISLSHTHKDTHTQARHSCHVILLGIMPTAKHVTYQKSLRQSERGGEREREWERFCTFASLWELLVKCKYSTYAGKVKCSCYSYLQCTVVWGLSILRRRKKKNKRHVMFEI